MQLEGPSLRQDPLGKRGDAHRLCFLHPLQTKTTEGMGSNTPRLLKRQAFFQGVRPLAPFFPGPPDLPWKGTAGGNGWLAQEKGL
jgi:hypothetical protein